MKSRLLKVLLLMIILLPFNVYANNRVINANDYNIYNRTKEEIYNHWLVGEIDWSVDVFSRNPSYISPYDAGEVTDEYLTEVVDNLNYYRYLVGSPLINTYPTNDEELQTAQVVQTLSIYDGNHLTHYVYNVFSKPDDMDEEFYNLGAYANHNIIAYGVPSEPNFFFFDESVYDESNPTAGHRMALISPEVNRIEYGFGDFNELGVVYGRVHANMSIYNQMENDIAAYPAPGNFPKQDFADISDWDVMLNPYKFKLLTTAETKDVTVIIRNLTTNEEEVRTVDNDNLQFDYYQIHIAQPTRNTTYYESDYEVYIENLIDSNGDYVDVTYTINFYDKFEGIDSPINDVMFDLNMNRIYLDGEYNESLVQELLADSEADVFLDSGSTIHTTIDSFNPVYIGKFVDNSFGYYYYPTITNLPTWANDDNNVLANIHISVYNYQESADYRFGYVDTTYKKNVGNAVTMFLSEFTPHYEGQVIYIWLHEVDGEIEGVDTTVNGYSSNGLNLTISNLTKEDAGTYYLAAIFMPTYYYGTRIYISKPLTLEIKNPAKGISVGASNANVNLGDTYQMHATTNPIDADDTITYSSSDETIATVDEFGTVTTLKEGTVTITASVSYYTATTQITITKLTYPKGDLNKNGQIDLADVIKLLKCYLNIEETTDEIITIGDMNDDNVIGLQDVIHLLKVYLGLIQ